MMHTETMDDWKPPFGLPDLFNGETEWNTLEAASRENMSVKSETQKAAVHLRGRVT